MKHDSRGADDIDAGVSEFGERMAELLGQVRQASGAVLSDDQGDPIDFARRRGRIEEIDVQIAGAQIGQCMVRLSGNSMVHGLGKPVVIVECLYGMLLAAPLRHRYLLTLVIDRRASISQVLPHFQAAAEDLDTFM